MKKFLCLIATAVFLLVGVFPVTAAQSDYSITLPDGFVAAAYGDDLTKLASIFDMNAEGLQRYYDENKVLYLAADKKNTCQITLTCTENEFSQGAVSFSRLSQAELETIAADLAGDSFTNHGIIEGKDGNSYIHLERKLTDSGGDYTVTEYLTVCSSNLFTLSISVSQTNSSDIKPASVLAGLKINDKARPSESGNGLMYTVLAAAGIAVFSALAVYLIYTVIRDMRRVRHNDDEQN